MLWAAYFRTFICCTLTCINWNLFVLNFFWLTITFKVHTVSFFFMFRMCFYMFSFLNKNITEIFGKFVNIYRGIRLILLQISVFFPFIFGYSKARLLCQWCLKALGDNRRSFSCYKAISVIEKSSFKIESADQIKNLPSIGKSMKDHVSEFMTRHSFYT